MCFTAMDGHDGLVVRFSQQVGTRETQLGRSGGRSCSQTGSCRSVVRKRRFGELSAPIAWTLEVAVKPDQVDTFRALMEEMVISTQGEPGALGYEWFIGEDGGVVHLHERYADSAAALAHLGTFSEWFAGRFLAAVDPTRLTVMGSPSDQVKAALSGLDPTFLRPFGGFVRESGS
jgi:quinol monooxygenase YgiN